MNKAKSIFTLSFVFVFYSIGFSQSLFIDSGQRLGNSCSWDVKLGDLNGDGYLDAVVANDNSVDSQFKNEIWLNNGNAAFNKSSQELGTGGRITLFDINNDAHLDIIEAIGSNIRTRINDGAANFTLSDKYSFRGNHVIFDKNINNNNQYEAVTSENIGNNTLLRFYSLNQTTVGLIDSITVTNFNLFFDYSGIIMSDLNNDGFSDMVLCQGSGPTLIMFNNRNGGFTKSSQTLGNGAYPNIYLGDLNGDGFLDLLQCNYHDLNGNILRAYLYFNDGTGKFTEAPLPYNTSYITPNAALVDLNNDGVLDIYLNHGHRSSDLSHKSEILINDGHGNFTSSTVNLDLVPSTGMAFGDLDKDGDTDVFLACGIYTYNAATQTSLFIGEPNRVWLNTTLTSVRENKNYIPKDYNLFQNYPNPFNPTTVISYSVPSKTGRDLATGGQFSVNSNVKLSIFDMLGREVSILVNEKKQAGNYSVQWNATGIPSGIYFYRLQAHQISGGQAGNTVATKKLVLLK
jgi:hypothetical protein